MELHNFGFGSSGELNESFTRKVTVFFSKYSVPLLILLSSRVVVALAIVFSSKFVGRSAGDFPEFSSRWYRYLLRWDAGWYFKIASEGYSYDGNDLAQHPVIFYPLYPLIAKAISLVAGISPGAALLVVSNAALIIAIALFFKFAHDEYGDAAAVFATATLCFFPTAFFFSAGYTESLALLLIVSFFLLLQRQQYLYAAIIAGLALATRSTGIILALPLLIELWRKYSRDWRRLVVTAAGAIALSTSGLWLYMLYLHFRFGNAFAFMTNIRAWREGIAVRNELFQALTLQPFRHLADVWNIGPDPNTLSPWFFLGFLSILIIFRKKFGLALLVYCFGVLLLPYLTLSGSLGFRSFTRYIMLAFPVFILLGNQFAQRAWLGLSVIAIFTAMLFMSTLFFTQWYFAG